MSKKHVVMVTGGSGCLGQHVIKLLQTRAKHVDEIRVIDVVPFEKKLDYKDRVPVTSVCLDISNLTDTSSFRGVTSVFHLASVISVSNFPDNEAMERVNIEGTRNILEACLEHNVSCVVYSSTVDVVCGYNSIVDGKEEATKPPESLLYQGYAGTKLAAETMVRDYNGKKLSSGGSLKTVSLRPTVFFGELDSYYIPTVLQKARDNKGVFVQLGDGSALYQHSYVGNVAWAFVCAEKLMSNGSDVPSTGSDIAGEVFFIADDIKPKGMCEQVQPFLEVAGYSLSSYKLPFYPIYGLVKMAQGILWFASFLKKIDLGFSAMSLRYINTTFTYNTSKARRLLGYQPIFSPEESLNMANVYYLGLLEK